MYKKSKKDLTAVIPLDEMEEGEYLIQIEVDAAGIEMHYKHVIVNGGESSRTRDLTGSKGVAAIENSEEGLRLNITRSH